MSLTRFCFASVLFLACHDAIAQDDEALIDDLPRARKNEAQATPKPRKKPLPGDANAPHAPRLNTDLIDDLSPGQKRAAAERSDEQKIENAIPDTLAEALARALHNSPAILVADAEVRRAQAELNEVRQSVVHDLTLAFKRRARIMGIAMTHRTAGDHQAMLEDEAKILYLLGIAAESPAAMYLKSTRPTNKPGPMSGKPDGDDMSAMGMMGGPPGAMPAMGMMPGSPRAMMSMMGGPSPSPAAGSKPFEDLPENVRNFLNKSIDLDFKEQPLQDVLAYIKENAGGDIDFMIQHPEELEGSDERPPALVTLSVKGVTVAAALQALADLNGWAFIFRDYGILVPSLSDDDLLEAYRASGARMIAPIPLSMFAQPGMGGRAMPGMGMPGMGMPGMGMPMGGPLKPAHGKPQNNAAEQQ